MLEYNVTAKRLDSHGGIAKCKDAEIALDTDVNGRHDAFNPAELFLAALAACMIKGIERAIPMLQFALRGVEVKVHGVRQDSPPKMVAVDYEIVVDTDESNRRLELLHTNVRKFGTISNTVAAATSLGGRIIRAAASASRGQQSVTDAISQKPDTTPAS
ncbi:MAG: OsmC family protein [Alphaproteobacteria bacterium]|nr:OsmC family protein [Alphaproteobacteria bacterium]